MTVAELRAMLATLPDDAPVQYGVGVTVVVTAGPLTLVGTTVPPRADLKALTGALADAIAAAALADDPDATVELVPAGEPTIGTDPDGEPTIVLRPDPTG